VQIALIPPAIHGRTRWLMQKKTIFMAATMKILYFLFFLAIPSTVSSQGKAPSHQLYHNLLQKNVSSEGKVNYPGFTRDSTELNKYLKTLRSYPPDEKTWTKNEQMTYWINAYNAFTIQLILKYYPLKSIRDIGSSIQVPFVNTPWDIKFITIGKERMDLNNIEHGILRQKFSDPRIHMALVCASKSCPRLLNEAYDAARLDEQLNAQCMTFLRDNTRNKLAENHAELSMIFKWYAADFSKNGGSLISFLNKYSPVKLKRDARITYMEYDWTLNE
jgi:hypothetical protein